MRRIPENTATGQTAATLLMYGFKVVDGFWVPPADAVKLPEDHPMSRAKAADKFCTWAVLYEIHPSSSRLGQAWITWAVKDGETRWFFSAMK